MNPNFLEELKKTTFRTRKSVLVFLIVVAAVLAILIIYFGHTPPSFKKDISTTRQNETKELLANIAKLVVLPEDETPTIATVSDPDKLKNQPFFARAKKGDKVLIYASARKAILYDPVANKIVEIAPINPGE